MAMDGDELGIEIAAAITSPSAPPDVQAQVIAHWQKIANVIVAHITDKGEVPAGIAVQAGAYTGQTTAAGKIQ